MKTVNRALIGSAIISTLSFSLAVKAQSDSVPDPQADQIDKIKQTDQIKQDQEANQSKHEEALEKNKIVITATRVARNVEDVAGTVTRIDSETLDKQIAENVADVVRYQPGLSMKTADRGGNQGFVIRGMDGKRVLMLLDGVRSSNVFAAGPSSYGNDSYELTDIKDIEIIRGPASALYGADALGGVVLMNSKDPIDYITNEESMYSRINVGTGSATNLAKISATLANHKDAWGYLLQATNRDFSEREVKGNGHLNPQDGNSLGALLKLTYQSDEATKWTATLDNFDQKIDYDLTDSDTPELLSSGLDETKRSRFSLDYLNENPTLMADKIETKLYWQTTDALQHTKQLLANSYSFDYAPFGNNNETVRVSDFEFNQNISGISSNLIKTYTTENLTQTFVYGFSYDSTGTERPRYRSETDTITGTVTNDISAYPMAPAESFPNKTFPDTTTKRFGVYLQDEIVFENSSITLIPGIRYDQINMSADNSGVQDVINLGYEIKSSEHSKVSKNFGIIYGLSNTSSLFFQYAEGFRAPSYDEANQSFANLGFGYALVPNGELKPETSRGYEVGYKVRSGRNYFSFAIYQNDFEDFISTSFAGMQNGLMIFQDDNIGQVQIEGAEITGNWFINDNWSLSQSIAYSKGKDQENATPLNQVDPLTSVLGISFTADSNDWGVETMITLVGEKSEVASETNITHSGYGLLDVTAYYNLNRDFSINFAAFNILDKKYARWANIQNLEADSPLLENFQEPGLELRLSLALVFD